MDYANKADDEDDYRAHMLQNHCRIGNERPEIVGFEAGVTLEIFEEGGLIGVVIRVYRLNVLAVAFSCAQGNKYIHTRLLYPHQLLPGTFTPSTPAPRPTRRRHKSIVRGEVRTAERMER